MSDVAPRLSPAEQKVVGEHARKLAEYRRSIRLFIREMWGLRPQGVKPSYAERYALLERSTGETWERMKLEVSADWFGTYNTTSRRYEWYDFTKGQHYTWQQNLLLMGIEKAIAGDAPRKLSVVSGHGTGKSASCSWVTLWFLYCFFESQVPVTAPTSSQMHDVLWKELAIWLTRMPDEIKPLYEWSKDYVRMNYAPESWFARARTSTKENTEAIAGVHADHVAIIVDEASGVPEQVFVTAQGALTSGNVLVVLISNGTRNIGYFFDTHHRHAPDWQLFAFDSEESPIVDPQFVHDMEKQYGRDSEEFRIRVKRSFPMEGVMDDGGYVQLIPPPKIIVRPASLEIPFMGTKFLGVDPSGEGKDKATFVIRDAFKAKLEHSLATTNPREIAEVTMTLIERHNLDPMNVVVGSMGVGADVGKEVALASRGKYEIYTVLEGNTPDYEERYNGRFFRRNPEELQSDDVKTDAQVDLYLNMRALMYFRAMRWLVKGGVLIDTSVDNSPFAGELGVIRYKRALQGNRIQLMPKKEMLKLRIPSPNIADAFALTFLRQPLVGLSKEEQEERDEADNAMTDDERFSVL